MPWKQGLRLTAGAVLFAIVTWTLLAAPGVISDQSSTVAVRP